MLLLLATQVQYRCAATKTRKRDAGTKVCKRENLERDLLTAGVLAAGAPQALGRWF
jgi:hypothetical protein